MLLIFLVVLLLFSIFMLRRNNQVYKECIRVLNLISALAKQDSIRGLPWQWRFDEFESISYDKMVLEFWKPVSSYFSFCCQENTKIKKEG